MLGVAMVVASMSIGAQKPADTHTPCNQPMAKPVVELALPELAMHPTVTKDGCWLFSGFVDLKDVPDVPNGSGIAVRRRQGDTYELVRMFPLPMPRGPLNGVPMGMALTSDDKVLVLSHGNWVTFLDVPRLTSGSSDAVLSQVSGPRISTSWGLALSPDDKYAFAAQQSTSAIAMLDVEMARAGAADQALKGVIGTSISPITPIVSPDGRYVYTANRFAADTIAPTLKCSDGRDEGVIQIIDIERAKADPRTATIGFASPAGCAPQNVAVSPDGARLSATAGGALIPAPPLADNSVVVFDARPVGEGKSPTPLGRIPMPAPPVLIRDTGKWIVVGFISQPKQAPDSSLNLLVVDPVKVSAGRSAIVGHLPFSALFLTLSPDRRTLYASRPGALAIIDVERLAFAGASL